MKHLNVVLSEYYTNEESQTKFGNGFGFIWYGTQNHWKLSYQLYPCTAFAVGTMLVASTDRIFRFFAAI